MLSRTLIPPPDSYAVQLLISTVLNLISYTFFISIAPPELSAEFLENYVFSIVIYYFIIYNNILLFTIPSLLKSPSIKNDPPLPAELLVNWHLSIDILVNL